MTPEAWSEQLADAAAALPGAVREVAAETVADAVERARANARARFATRTGHLVGSIHAGGSADAPSLVADAAGARILEEGGTVRPVRAPFLAFSTGGRFTLAREAHIPARPFLAPAFEAAQATVPARLDARVEAAFGGSRGE